MPDLALQLHSFIDSRPDFPRPEPSSARDWLERAHEQAYADDPRAARRAVERGLALDPEPATRLALLAAATSMDVQLGDQVAATGHLRVRNSLLRDTGQRILAEVERELGTAYFGPVTELMAARLRAAERRHDHPGTPDTVLADLRMPLALWDLERGAEPRTDVLFTCARAYRDAGQLLSLADALLALAPALAAAGDVPASLHALEELAGLGGSTGTRAMALMARAGILRGDRRPVEARYAAFEALELFDEAGIRRGAISAAVLLAELAGEDFENEAAQLAWRIAIDQAERAETAESWALRLGLGEQLLFSGDCDGAAALFSRLATELPRVDSPATRARILSSWGNALFAQADRAAAREAWVGAADLYAAHGLEANAASLLLTAGQLAPADMPPLDEPGLFEQAVQLALKAHDPDGAVLAHALLARGGALAAKGTASGKKDIESAIALARTAGNSQAAARFGTTLADAQAALGDTATAITTALQAADELRSHELLNDAVRAELLAAELFIEAGLTADAVRLYRSLSRDGRLDPELLHEVLQLLGHGLDLLGDAAESAAAFARAAAMLRPPGE
ncbi:hypothetical protein [Paeniglutamicibacter cryotolerans]|uniref:Tetratricopeptide repeat protein n=1 Tax=Paeniglutamicibacter cryotolerans TaxID=670079 RepID=A0A839QKZ8_9MICC|nr:hypothetical protein [Paeniglutamicibacter cryotolerans]MBB2993842.1 hypothetical protein [Paeniglutamicibacter cryotolerans]